MDGSRFDQMTKRLSERRSRREAVRALVGGALGGAAAVVGAGGVLAAKPARKPDCCPASAPKLCGLTCVDLTRNAANCGACGNACTGGATCHNGSCTCPSGQTLCDDTCVTTATSLTNCGHCGNVCPASANGTATCVTGTCGFVCDGGYATCGTSCVNTSTDSTNCGLCGHACGAGESCTNGACAATCTVPTDCPGIDTACRQRTCIDGVCGFVDLEGTLMTCGVGACRVSIQSCVNGVAQPCVPLPPRPEVCNGIDDDCDGVVDNGFDLATDPNNCGGCGIVCSAPNAIANCTNRVCGIAACNSGYADCNGLAADGCETNVANDAMNCGTCGNVCPAGTSCVAGHCVQQCQSSADCGASTPCQTFTCTNGTCGVVDASAGTVCAPASCSGSTATQASVCDDTGRCAAGPTVNCTPYVCDGSGTTCLTTCTGDNNCLPEFQCSNGICVAAGGPAGG
jgi:hypothetical protein